MTRKIFVYGTLQKGQGNNHLLNDCKFLGQASVQDYKLLDSGFPVAFPSPGSDIFGEVWEVPSEIEDQVIDRLDWLENEGSMYIRTEGIAIEGKNKHECELYVGSSEFWQVDVMRECFNKDNLYFWRP